MSLTNRVSLIGHLGKDADTKSTRINARFTMLSVATRRSWKDRETGEWQSRTTWHRVVCWGRLVEYAGALTKGTHVQIEGEITKREYVTKPGEKKTSTEVRANQIAKLMRPKKDDSQGTAA